MQKYLFIIALVLIGLNLSKKTAFAAPFCVVAGSVQQGDQAYVQADITIDATADQATFFPFTIKVANTTSGQQISSNTVSSADCPSTTTNPLLPRTCTYRLTGTRALFGIPNNNTQQLSFFLQLTSSNSSVNCQNALAVPIAAAATTSGTNTGSTGTTGSTSDTIGVTNATFDTFNTAIFGKTPDAQLTTPRGIISRLLPYLMTFGGLILFIMLIWGGFEMLTGAANPKSQEAGKARITAAIIGFILLFSSYWLAQLVQAIFGISIL